MAEAQKDLTYASLSSGANVEIIQAAENQEVTNSPESDTPIFTPIESKFPPELQKIIDCWDNLPEHIKAAIKALIDTHNQKEQL